MTNIQDKRDAIELMLPVDPAYVSAARRTAASISERMGFSTEAVEDIKTAVSEACNFIIKHSCHAGAEHFNIIFIKEDEKNLSICLNASINKITNHEDTDNDMCVCVMRALMNQLDILFESSGIGITMLKEKRRVHLIEGD